MWERAALREGQAVLLANNSRAPSRARSSLTSHIARLNLQTRPRAAWCLRAAIGGLRFLSRRGRLPSRVQACLRAPPSWQQMSSTLQHAGCSALDAQDVACATLLSELVYRAAECNDDASFHRARAVVEAELGASLAHINYHKAGGQRYLTGETEDAIYVAFQGTKHATDWLANLTFFHAPLWHKHSSKAGGSSSSSSSTTAGRGLRRSGSSSSGSSSSSVSSSSSARAHVGFIRRANHTALYISALHDAAAASGRRLVLTGHSLGGAVATLTTVRLLRSLSLAQPGCSSSAEGPALGAGGGCRLLADPRVRCISFATPAVANTDLLQEVSRAGWDRYITNLLIPEDNVVPVVNALLKAPPSPMPAQLRADPLSRLPLGSITAACGGFCRHGSAASSSSRRQGVRELVDLHYEPLRVSADAGRLCSGTTAAAHSSSSLQQPRSQPVAVAAASGFGPGPEGPWQPDSRFAGAGSLAAAGVSQQAAAAATAGMGGSAELHSWLVAAEGAVSQRERRRQQQLQRSLSVGSVAHSSSELSLCSLQSSVPTTSSAWSGSSLACSSNGSSSDGSSLGSLADRLEASLLAASAAAVSFLTGGGSSPRDARRHDSSSFFSDPGAPPGSSSLILEAAAAMAGTAAVVATTSQQAAGLAGQESAAAAAAAAAAGGKRPPMLGLGKARLAWITGTVAAGMRCAAALTAPHLIGAHAGPLLSLPRALLAPFSLAALHLVGSAAIKAALPVSHPLGQQWVLTGQGLEVAARPLPAYPRDGKALRLKELGGFCPGHRMIAYRRRVVALLDDGHL